MSSANCQPNPQYYNFTQIPYPKALRVVPTKEIATKVTLGVIVEIVSLLGNLLVIIIILRSKRMRTTTNYFLLNLAISDLLVALIPIWVHVVVSLNEFWPFGSFLCKFNPFMQCKYVAISEYTTIANLYSLRCRQDMKLVV